MSAMRGNTYVFNRDVAMIVFVAAIFILAIAYSVLSATTIADNINTGGSLTVSGVAYASSTLQATGDGLFYDQLSAGASTNTPTTTFNVTGSGYFTVGLGVGYATTGSGNLLVQELGVFRSRLGVAGTSSPAVEFGVTGSGLFSGGLGVGYATTSAGGFRNTGLTLHDNRVGISGTSSPYQEFGLTGDHAQASAATTTISLESTSSGATGAGGCIELKGQNPERWVRIYVSYGRGTSTTNTFEMYTSSQTHSDDGGNTPLLVVELGRCQ